MGIIKKLLDLFRPKKNGDGETKENKKSKVTNKTLYAQLIEQFESDMEELSVGREILYPMSFNILLHPDDFKRVGESLPFILPEVIARFYAAIKTKKSTLHDSYVTQTATYWFFQFASSSVKTTDNEESFINPGEIVTVTHLTTFDIKKAQQGIKTENPLLSVKCQNSNVNQNNINMDALLGMEILTNNAFIFNFDKNMSEDLNDIQHSQRKNNDKVLAELVYSEGLINVHLNMLDDLITLSGPDEKRSSENILIIKNAAVQVGHVQIRYIQETNKFQLCAYAQTRLNSKVVPISTGGSPIWENLSYNSAIFLNNAVNVTFKASDDIISKGPQ